LRLGSKKINKKQKKQGGIFRILHFIAGSFYKFTDIIYHLQLYPGFVLLNGIALLQM
jgi:hypothetical protein